MFAETMSFGEIMFACGIGIGTVFVGLICLIFITMLMSAVLKNSAKTESGESKPAPVAPAESTTIANKQEIIAGVCAAIAEELGTGVSNIKVVSFKKL